MRVFRSNDEADLGAKDEGECEDVSVTRSVGQCAICGESMLMAYGVVAREVRSCSHTFCYYCVAGKLVDSGTSVYHCPIDGHNLHDGNLIRVR